MSLRAFNLWLWPALLLGFVSASTQADQVAFIKALKTEDMKTAYSLLGYVDDVNRPLDDGRTALMLASKFGMKEMVGDLIRAGADVNARNHNGGTALMYSAIRGDEATVDILLQRGASVNLTAKFGWSALMVASAKGHAVIVRKLVNSGADVNSRDVYHWTPLMRASFAGYAEAVSELLAHPLTDVNAGDENEASALHHAATNGHKDVVRVLLDHCARMSVKDKFGWSPLDRAIANEDELIVEILRDYESHQTKCQ
ncbi:MAG: ankyrin repeat domain-containing protein [Acidiferrobacterales bacterium]|nr:ankyrin repeat domain-containing protein [Acidiferrobacterales bacterium]